MNTERDDLRLSVLKHLGHLFRSRKTGSMTMVSYLSSGFVYAKVANLVLFFRADPRMGLVYLLLFVLQVLLGLADASQSATDYQH